jgi:PAS domain S-box-containing protein
VTDVPDYAHLGLKAPRKRSYVIIAILVPLAFAGLLRWLRVEYFRAESLRTQVVQSYERRIALVTLQSRISDAETAQRGFLLTRNPALLEPLQPARDDISRRLAIIAAARDGQLATHIPHIQRLVAGMLGELDRTIALTRTGHRDVAMRSVSNGLARRIMDRLEMEIGLEVDREDRTTAREEMAFQAQRTRLRHIMALCAIVAAVVVAGLLALAWSIAWKRYSAILGAFETAKGNATFFDSTIGAVLIVGPTGKIEVMNAAAVALLGYYVDETDRRDIATVVDIAPGEGSFHKRLGLVDGQLQRTQLTDRVVRDRLGRDVPVDVAMGVLHAQDGDRIVVSLRDISERKRLDRVKDDLMSTVSHEIRTPLTSIVGSLGLLRTGIAGTLPDDATRLIDIAENNSRRLIRLIDDLLDIDRIESGKLGIEREAIDLRAVLARARTGSEGIARDHGIALACIIPDQPVVVSGDPDRLLQVISNLVSNAVRVAPRGSTIDLTLSVDAAGCARVNVADRGPGVPLAFRTRIFGRFERATSDDSVRGTGLGLAISREIVTLHGGRIWFEDRPGGGTIFAFTLTQIDADAAPRVLLCCDHETLSEALAATVIGEGAGYEVVRSSAQARAALSARDYAMLLIDLELPGGGLDLARAARDHDPAFTDPIVLLAARAGGTDDGAVALDLVDLVAMPEQEARLRRAVVAGLTRSHADERVIVHLCSDRDRAAALALLAAELEPGVGLVTARDTREALLAGTVPALVIADLTRHSDPMPFLFDSRGVAIPTLLYAAHDLPEDLSSRAIVTAPPAAPIDVAATIRRGLVPRAIQSRAA